MRVLLIRGHMDRLLQAVQDQSVPPRGEEEGGDHHDDGDDGVKLIDWCITCDRPMDATCRMLDHQHAVRIVESKLEDASQSNARR